MNADPKLLSLRRRIPRLAYGVVVGALTGAGLVIAGVEEGGAALRADLWALAAIGVGTALAAAVFCLAMASRTHRKAAAMAAGMTAAVRRNDQELHKLALVASRTDNSVLITDSAGRIEWTNDGFVRLTGFSLAEVRGSSALAPFRCDGADDGQLARLEASLREGRRMREELPGMSKSGRRYWCSLDIEPIRGERGELVQFCAIQRDITARKEADERLRAYHADIIEANVKLGEQARELAQRAVELERATAAAEAASTAKSEFLANMSHEIRTPLHGVVGALELLRRTELSERQARYARMASVSGATLLALINDILDYSKLGAGKVELESIDIDIGALCEELQDMFARRVEEKGITLSCQSSALLPRIVRGDPTRLRQLLLNLVSNAIKFTSAGGVVVRVAPEGPAAQPGEPAQVRFTVTDSGIGIPSDRVDRLFKSFSQVDASTTRRYGGTGLGLAICKSIVDLMGGQIGVSSESGHGSTFWFTIPLAVATDQTGHEQGAWRGLRHARLGLLVDDKGERASVAALLDGWGFGHRDGGLDAAGLELSLGAAGSGSLDVAIVGAATLDGALAFARRITEDARGERCAVVLLVDPADIHPSNERRFRAAGVSVWVRRPASESELLDGIVAATACCRRPVLPATAGMKPVEARRIADAGRGLRVLVGEDNEINQAIATELLSEAGLSCTVAPDGRRVVEEALSGGYDVVLMDCQMPELDGFEATRRIREAEKQGTPACRRARVRTGERVPIIALTANALPQDRERCLDAGMDDYLTKPLNPDLLIEAIERYCVGGEGGARPQPLARDVGPASPACPPQTGPLAVLDLDGFASRCRGKPEMMASILGKFAEVARTHVARCRDAVANGDAPEAARAAHALKGAAANIGALRLTEAARALENCSKAAEPEAMTLAFASMRDAAAEVALRIPDTVASIARGGPGPFGTPREGAP